MEVVLPYGYNKNNTSVTSIDFINYPYLVSTKKETYVMTREEIIMRLESAIYDKDWAAVELLLEYAHESGCDINPIIDSRELGEVIRSLLVFFGKMNGVDADQLNWEQSVDISNLYNDNGFLASVDKDKD